MPEDNTNVFYNGVISIYSKLLSETAKNTFYRDAISSINNAIEGLQISEEKKAELLISHQSNMANNTISKSMDQSVMIYERSSKIDLENTLLQKQIDEITNSIEIRTAQNTKDIEVKTAQITSIAKDNLIKDKQVAKLDEEIDLLESQDLELKESILDRQQKRPVEVANLTKQGTLIDGQVSKLIEDTLYVIAQKTSMLEQVGHNKIIKAMDSMGDMIGTIGAGGLVPSASMFGVYFSLNQQLTNVTAPTSYSITKVV